MVSKQLKTHFSKQEVIRASVHFLSGPANISYWRKVADISHFYSTTFNHFDILQHETLVTWLLLCYRVMWPPGRDLYGWNTFKSIWFINGNIFGVNAATLKTLKIKTQQMKYEQIEALNTRVCVWDTEINGLCVCPIAAWGFYCRFCACTLLTTKVLKGRKTVGGTRVNTSAVSRLKHD